MFDLRNLCILGAPSTQSVRILKDHFQPSVQILRDLVQEWKLNILNPCENLLTSNFLPLSCLEEFGAPGQARIPFNDLLPEFRCEVPLQLPRATTRRPWEMIVCKLWFFQVPTQQLSLDRPLRYRESLQYAHEVGFDRGQLRENVDQEAKRMADCNLRVETFLKSRFFKRGHEKCLSLALIGMYHIDDPTAPDFIRCSFCKKEFKFGIRFEHSPAEFEVETLLVHLRNKHALLAPTCPMAFGMKGDNKDLQREKFSHLFQLQLWVYRNENRIVTIAQYSHRSKIDILEKLILSSPAATIEPNNNLPHYPELESTVHATSTDNQNELGANRIGDDCEDSRLASIADPALDDEEYFLLHVEFELETFSDLGLPQSTSEINLPELEYAVRAPITLVDANIGPKVPKYANYIRYVDREASYASSSWFSRQGSPDVPDIKKLVDAGFFYDVRDVGSVKCFWCDLGLKNWSASDDPWREHAKHAPRCPWLLRCKSRQYVKMVLYEAYTLPGVPQTVRERFKGKHDMITKEIGEQHGITFFSSTPTLHPPFPYLQSFVFCFFPIVFFLIKFGFFLSIGFFGVSQMDFLFLVY